MAGIEEQRTLAAEEPAERLVRPPGARRSEYADLSRQVKGAGLLERKPAYYSLKIASTTAMLAAGWAAFFLVGDSWWQVVVAVYLAFAFTQVAFLGHDAGHKQVFRTRRANGLLGLALGNVLIGLSFGWWVGKHNRHHSHPNELDRDPDITIGAIAFTADQARSKRGLTRLVVRYQAYLFFPMLLMEAVHLHAASIRAVVRGTIKLHSVEALLLLAHGIGYLAGLLVVLSPARAAVFLIVQQGLFGLYLGCAFAPNHKGMPVLREGEEPGFLRRQVLTSRNVRGNWLTDFALGGLNYQIEHHLFPSMPRPSLRRSQALVREFCAEHRVPYCESGIVGSYAEALRHLHQVGAPLRRPLPAAGAGTR